MGDEVEHDVIAFGVMVAWMPAEEIVIAKNTCLTLLYTSCWFWYSGEWPSNSSILNSSLRILSTMSRGARLSAHTHTPTQHALCCSIAHVHTQLATVEI